MRGCRPEGIANHVTEGFPPIGDKYKYQGRERHEEIGETEIVRVNTLVLGNRLCVAT